jgi:hypothetical protein
MSVAGNLGRQTFPVPIGSIFLFAGALPTIPVTYLVCDGSAFDPAKYPLLQTALGGSNTPDLRQKIIGGGPLIDVGQLIPPVTGTVTASGFTLTKENIPTVPFDVTVTTISTVASIDGGGDFLINPLTATVSTATPPDGNSISTINPPTVTSADFDLPDVTFVNDTPTEVTPTVTLAGDATNPAVLVFRYIIKAEY